MKYSPSPCKITPNLKQRNRASQVRHFHILRGNEAKEVGGLFRFIWVEDSAVADSAVASFAAGNLAAVCHMPLNGVYHASFINSGI